MSGAIKLSGFKGLHDALGELPKSTERALLRRVAKNALEIFHDDARSHAPVETGGLVDSIIIGSRLTKGARKQDRKDPRHGVRLFCGTSHPAAVPQEFGTVKMAAHPFMRPAWESTKHAMLDRVGDQLKIEIEKTAKRAAKRGGK